MDGEGRRLRRDVAWNLAPVVLLGGVGVGMQLGIARWWDAETLGVFNLVTTAFFVFAVIGACGLQYAVLRAVAEAQDDRERIAAASVGALVPAVVLATCATAVFLALRGPIVYVLRQPAVGEGMLWAAPGLLCFAINKVLFGIVNGLRRMRAFAVYTSLRYVLVGGALIGAKAGGVAGPHLPGIWTLGEGILLLVLGVEVIRHVPAHPHGWRRYAREHLGYGARGVLSTLAYELNNKLDVWLLASSSRLLGVPISHDAVGIYSLAAELHIGAQQLAVAVQYNVNPMIARELAAGHPREVEVLVRRTRRWFVPALCGACALGAAMFPLVIPRLVGNPAFSDGALPFLVLMIGLAVASPYLPFNQLLLMANRPGTHTALVVIVAAINLGGNCLLIPALGPLGAALGTACAVASSALLVRWLARVRADVRI